MHLDNQGFVAVGGDIELPNWQGQLLAITYGLKE